MTENKKVSANQPSKDLLDLMSYVNLIPMNFDLPSAEIIYRQKFKELTRINSVELDVEESQELYFYDNCAQEYAVNQIGLCVKQFPNFLKDLNELSIKLTICGYFSSNRMYQCNEFVKTRQDVEKVIAWSASEKEGATRVDKFYAWFGNFESLLFPDFDKNSGIINLTKSLFARAIDGIEIDRLRICQNCNRVFWAYNKNSLGCSKNCANNIRQKRKRTKDKKSRERQSASRVKHEDNGRY